MQVSRAPRCFGTRVMLIASAAAAIMGWAYSVPVYSASGPLAGPPVAGHSAPPFSVPALSGEGQVTLAQFAGHPLVITFFSTDCEACWPDMSLLEKAYGRYRSRGLVIVGVGVQDTVSSLRRMVKSLNVTFPIGNDENGASAARYRLTSIPTTVFVGGDGVVRSVLEGNLDDRTLQKQLTPILPKSASAL